jgi:hypothetical protein
MICDLKRKDWDAIMMFDLSSDAKYASMEMIGTVDELGYPMLNGFMFAFTFPPEIEQGTGFVTRLNQINASGSNYGGCNAAISASGNILYNFQGAHTSIYASIWDHNAMTATKYTIGTGSSGSLDLFKDVEPVLHSPWGAGECFTNPQGSCNSDQVIVAINFWEYGVGVGERESNQIIMNWKTKEAVYTTRFPDTRLSPGGKMANFFYADMGDFWVDGGAANPGNKYQTVDGSWIEIPGAVAVHNISEKNQVSWMPERAISGNVAMYSVVGKRLSGDAGTSAAFAMSHHNGIFLIRTADKRGNPICYLAQSIHK